MVAGELEKYQRFYSVELETKYFGEIRKRFLENNVLSAFDFFCIVIWKSNRSKTKVAEGLMKKTGLPLEDVVKEITRKVFEAKTDKDKVRALLVAGIGIPIASAILSVLYPDNFTVYDYRASDYNALKEFRGVVGKDDKAIQKYLDYVSAVRALSSNMTLREIDRCLWGKSFYEQLKKDVEQNFRGI